jgi:hypothetical protein
MILTADAAGDVRFTDLIKHKQERPEKPIFLRKISRGNMYRIKSTWASQFYSTGS